ncbi:50S ribosomal protein L11 methyltransferase [Baekduia sp. Peel2402]|uniref:50S ribosomal protein L11 methyltransferase n=1 Tax=Baekduia sp. Peel2402 TaxID=3458296 RepID=UPI00403EC1EE
MSKPTERPYGNRDRTPESPHAVLRAAWELRESHPEKARRLAARAVDESDPLDGKIRSLAGAILSRGVPRWHFAIVQDRGRLEAYRTALARAITPGARVLEIGTGSGILAAYAHRLGAGSVVTCEVSEPVALAARLVLDTNGCHDVVVVNKHSTDLQLGRNLLHRADVLVSEIISNELIGEGVLQAHADAIQRLTKPTAQVIPARGHVKVALASDSRISRGRMDVVDGIDLTPFNLLAPRMYSVSSNDPDIELTSKSATLFTFDLTTCQAPASSENAITLDATGHGTNGIVQWIALDLDDDVRYENRPSPSSESSWEVLFHPLPPDLHVSSGDTVSVGGSHDGRSVYIWGAKPRSTSHLERGSCQPRRR